MNTARRPDLHDIADNGPADDVVDIETAFGLPSTHSTHPVGYRTERTRSPLRRSGNVAQQAGRPAALERTIAIDTRSSLASCCGATGTALLAS
ncbi:hypothetical protein [Kutzneria sp. 744]|uniref:hypothetical protein n=1 Tax=Kutzneria sp. (strain 744) TaxID=345341 RepID=UPI0004AD7A9B|nr:hypothetical protein [Kutzneria sp. 744]